MLFQILSALIPSVAIVDSEYLDLGPFLLRKPGLLRTWLDHVEDDGDTIFICLADKSHVRVGRKRSDDPEVLGRYFRCLKKWKLGAGPDSHVITGRPVEIRSCRHL